MIKTTGAFVAALLGIATLLPAQAATPETDRAEIVDALYRFGAGQDLDDAALFESAFSPGAKLDFVGPAKRFGVTMGVMEGRAKVMEIVLGTVSRLDTTHTVTNPRITFKGDKAHLFALVEAQHLPKGDNSRHLLLKNIYNCDLSRSGDRWVIDHMKIDNVWYDGDPSVLFGKP